MENKKEEPKLREIKATTASRSYTTGAGTGPDDCMSQEMFFRLCDMGALKTEVYVCGWGWTAPYSGSGSSSGSSSSSSGGSSSSGSSSGSSGDSDWIGAGGNFGWEGWSGWSGWNDFSGSSWNYSGSSGLSDSQKMAILGEIATNACNIFGRNYNVRLPREDESCGANAKAYNGEVIVGNNFFNYDSSDQMSILWHEFYHLQYSHAQESDNIRLPQEFVLQPDEDLKQCLMNILRKKDEGFQFNNPTFEQYALDGELKHTVVHTPQWYRNEIETYKAEIQNSINKTNFYKCEIRWNLWKYEQLLRISERYD